MGHEVAVISGHHYPHIKETNFSDKDINESIQYKFPWEEGKIPNNWFITPEASQVPSPEPQNNQDSEQGWQQRTKQVEYRYKHHVVI